MSDNQEPETRNDRQQGKKGGFSFIDPTTIGAMVGAAIGGLAGLALGNKQTRKELAHVKNKALKEVSDIMDKVEDEVEPIKKEIKT